MTSKNFDLSVIVPVYNEENTIALILKKLIKMPMVKQIVLVNDGSTDKTLLEAEKVKKSFRSKTATKKLTIITKRNGGKGSAVRYGLDFVNQPYVLIQDADLEYDPEDIPDLIEPIIKGKSEVVYGSRFIGAHLNLLFWHRLGNSFLNSVVNLLYNTTLSDMETCYKVLPTRLLRELKVTSNDFAIEPEITCKLLKKGHKIYEVPISYVGRDFSQGKKITWKDGLTAVKVILTQKLI